MILEKWGYKQVPGVMHPREVFFIEGQFIQEGEVNDCAWSVLATNKL